MEGDGDELEAVESNQNSFMDGDGLDLSQNLFLDHAGEVLLTLNSDGLSWRSVETKDNELDGSCCFGLKLCSGIESEIKFSDVYAVEFINWGSINYSVLPKTGISLLGHDSKMYRFTVHGFQRSKTRRSLWVLAMYTFGHQDLQMCQMWVNRINGSINMDVRRPKSLLVFIHPLSGKRHGLRTWESVAPIFSRAKVKTKVTVTEKAGHAFDVMASITDRELGSYDGVVAVGGDGFFNEILNGLLSSRHKAPYPPAPMEVVHSAVNSGSAFICDPNPNEINSKTSNQDEDQDPLLPPSQPNISGFSKLRTEGGSCSKGKDPTFFFPNEWFRLGIIPAGSTDAIVICTTGTRDPITSALHIVLGKKVCLDIAQVVRWKTTVFSNDDAPFVRYAASFAGYGFYGDVIKESEKYRWMGPKRYDFVGTKVFMKHRSYEAEISYLEVKTEKVHSIPLTGHLGSEKRSRWGASNKPERQICCANCTVCNDYTNPNSMPKGVPITTTNAYLEESRWLQSKGRFLSVGAAVISCRNERAPDGLVADAHLADGFLHLILIKECPHAFYLWHLTQLARKGGDPLKFAFVEHHKTPAFTFTSSGKESIWNLDGELFQAHQLSAQVFRGLVSLFASGPEV